MGGISKICSNVYNLVKTTAKEYPVASACITGGAILGAVAVHSVVATKKQSDKVKPNEVLNYFLLSNPILNPVGFVFHLLNPKDINAKWFDNPLLWPLVKMNNKTFENLHKQNAEKGLNVDA